MKYLKANEWLASYDMLSGEMWTEREFALAEYLPYMLVGFYPLFQERGAPKVERPKADWEVRDHLPTIKFSDKQRIRNAELHQDEGE